MIQARPVANNGGKNQQVKETSLVACKILLTAQSRYLMQ